MEPLGLEKQREIAGPGVGVEEQAHAELDVDLWSRFAEAGSAEVFCQTWLMLQCRMIPRTVGGVLLLGEPDRGPYAPSAVWPPVRRSLAYLSTAAEQALRTKQGVVTRGGGPEGAAAGQAVIAYPIQVAGRTHGAVVLELKADDDRELQGASRRLHWGAAWLEVLFRRQAAARDFATIHRLQTLFDVLATTLGHTRFQGAATAFVTELATHLACDRVTLGFVHRGHARIVAMSHSAQFDKRTNLVQAIEAAMDEALEQGAPVVYPAPDEIPQVVRAHAALARQYGAGAILSLPVAREGRVLAALTLERPADQPFPPETVELCEAVAAVAGPVLDLHRQEDRWIGAKVAAACRRQLGRLLGPGHLELKLATVILAAAVVFLARFETDFHVTAKTVTEGLIQRAAVAPFPGYIKRADHKAGDVVREGEVLAALEDRELTLERLKWISQLEQSEKQYRQALADRDPAQVEIYAAQTAQARAQLALVEDRLRRTEVRAPFDGVIVSGDLTQALGAPVEQGQTLFEVAPLDAYRVILKVDERDIVHVAPGQAGQLILSAMPSEALPFEVVKVTPVSTVEEGLNYFRVEAKLSGAPDRLRPGMEGVAKIAVGRALLVWVASRRAIDWITLELWRWMP